MLFSSLSCAFVILLGTYHLMLCFSSKINLPWNNYSLIISNFARREKIFIYLIQNFYFKSIRFFFIFKNFWVCEKKKKIVGNTQMVVMVLLDMSNILDCIWFGYITIWKCSKSITWYWGSSSSHCRAICEQLFWLFV